MAKLTLADGTQNVELTKDAAGWQVQANGYVRTADAAQVNNMVNNLAELQMPVAGSDDVGQRERFEVSKKFQRRIELQDDSGAQLALLYTGTSPGLGKVHARSDAADEVYAVDLANYQLPMTLDDWLDKALLALPKDLKEITVQVGAEDTKKTWQLRNDLAQGWLLDGAKADQAAVLSYLGQLQKLRVIGLAEMGAIVSQDYESFVEVGSLRWQSIQEAGVLVLHASISEEAEFLLSTDDRTSKYRVTTRVGEGFLPDKEDLKGKLSNEEPSA